MVRTLLAAIVCLAIGLVSGFYLGRQSQPTAKMIAVPSVDGGSRSRTLEPNMPPPPDAAAQPSGQVPAVLPPPVSTTQPAPSPASGDPLAISLPIDNLQLRDIQDTFNQSRGGGSRKHEATDIMAARGTPVRAVSDGTVKKLFLSKAGGITIYQFDPTETYCFYYAHLDRYADGLREGMHVKRGDLIGYVGSTGDADPSAPHLHFAVFQLGPEKNWWHGTPINPYGILVDAWNRQAR